MESEKTLTIQEAAREYKASECTIRRYIAKKIVPSSQAGKGTLIRIPRDAWDRFLERKGKR